MQKKRIGLIDADLLDNGTRHPNLALMKISGFKQSKGHKTELLLDYDHIQDYDEVWLSKVFTSTKVELNIPEYPHKIPKKLSKYPNLKIGGTGFFFDKAPNLPDKIEHHMPDYHLYDEYVQLKIKEGIKEKTFTDYMHYSIGFATRGCMRKCDFCVNRKYDTVLRHAEVREFYNKDRKHIYLWDDNIFGYPKWRDVFDELSEIGRRFQFRQGMDIRLLTKEKATVLASSKYIGDIIFAFDFLKDREIVEKKLKIWRKQAPTKTTKLYILCAFESQDINDIVSVFKRLKILMKYRCLPYIMRFDSYKGSEFEGIYITLARWCNQPNFFKKKSFREFCKANGKRSSAVKYMVAFQKKHPEIAKKYFDLKFEKMPKNY